MKTTTWMVAGGNLDIAGKWRGADRRSADCQSAVSQNGILRSGVFPSGCGNIRALPSATRRYSRVPLCATRVSICALLMVMLAFTIAAHAATNDLTTLLQKGLFEEEADRNLDAAISNYQSLANDFDQDRQLAATAIFRLGECYRKLGHTNEAVAQYQRIVREFSDQQTLATLSQQNLAGLGATAGTASVLSAGQVVGQVEAAPITDEEEKEIRGIQALIQNSPDLINAGSAGPDHNWTPLYQAAVSGWLNVAAYLLDHGADVNLVSQFPGDTPLFAAAHIGNRAMVELLLSHGADVNGKSHGRTPLHIAAEKGFLAVTETLLDHKADVNASADYSEQTPLHLAAERDHTEIIKLLLAHGADVNAKDNQGATPLSYAVDSGSVRAVNVILAAKPNVNAVESSGRTALSLAAGLGNIDIVKALLEEKADPNAGTNDLPLTSAIISSRDRTNICTLLLRAGADPNRVAIVSQPSRIFSASPIEVAVDRGQTDTVKLLLDYKGDANAIVEPGSGYTALMRAVLDGNTELAKALIEHGANVNATSSTGGTALVYSVGKGSLELTELLISNDANVNVQSRDGITPLAYAKEYQKDNIVALLREHGALDDLPNFNAIRVTRQGMAAPAVVFERQSNDWNHYTLLEVIRNYYFTAPVGVTPIPSTFSERVRALTEATTAPKSLPFPDLARIIIHRPNRVSVGKGQDIKVNLLDASNTVDCAKDVLVEFGDVIEIPIRDHALNEEAIGLSSEQINAFNRCLAKQVHISVRSQTREVSLPASAPDLLAALQMPEAQSLLLSSSDLTRVKVVRKGPTTDNTREYIEDTTKTRPSQDLWLENGDVIEVPEKPGE